MPTFKAYRTFEQDIVLPIAAAVAAGLAALWLVRSWSAPRSYPAYRAMHADPSRRRLR